MHTCKSTNVNVYILFRNISHYQLEHLPLTHTYSKGNVKFLYNVKNGSLHTVLEATVQVFIFCGDAAHSNCKNVQFLAVGNFPSKSRVIFMTEV